MTYLQTTVETMEKPKITVLPPAPQDIFFQETQFDEEIGSGVDPIRWWQGSVSENRNPLPSAYGLTVQKNRLKKAEKELEGHEHKDEIMKILRSGLND